MDTAMEAKLREMIDRDEIWQVLIRYGRGLDRLDVEMARSCYFDDATEDHGHFVGKPDDFIQWANNVSLRYVTTQHAVFNHYCELDSDDAYAETYYQFTGTAEKEPHLLSTGRYIDHFQRRNNEWRIANRVAIVEGTYELRDDEESKTFPPAYGPDEVYPASRDKSDVSYQRPLRPRPPKPSGD